MGSKSMPNKSCPGAFKPHLGRNVPKGGGAKSTQRKKRLG